MPSDCLNEPIVKLTLIGKSGSSNFASNRTAKRVRMLDVRNALLKVKRAPQTMGYAFRNVFVLANV